MSNVLVQLATKVESFAPGTSFGGYVYTIAGKDAVTTTELSVTFLDVAAGDNTATVQAIDATGAPLGLPATAAFNVPAPVVVEPNVDIAVADTITVTVQ